jgi:hypothetical protein
MAYLHISNLERDTNILQFRNVYALEKIHGTSAHIKWHPEPAEPNYRGAPGLSFFSGGESHEKFVALFDVPALTELFKSRFDRPVTVYGEAYGGSQQRMSATYGDKLRFVAFDVKIYNPENGSSVWLDVPKAEQVALGLGLDFVDYKMVSTKVSSEDIGSDQELLALFETCGALAALVRERDRPSVQAVRNGITESKKREGVVLRPPFEVSMNNGSRLIAKFKNAEFSERKSSPSILDPEKQLQLTNANNVAFEFVTPMRLDHVINRLISSRDDKSYSIADTKKVIDLMVEDVEREGAGEFQPSPAVRKAIGSATVNLFKKHLHDKLREEINAK